MREALQERWKLEIVVKRRDKHANGGKKKSEREEDEINI